MVQYHAMGHPGYALFETEYGITCPTLRKDFLKIWAEVCKEEGIKFGFYFSSGYAEIISRRYPQWRRKKVDGSSYEGISGAPLCFNSPYVEEVMIPMLKELIIRYDASHFWLDGDIWSVKPCWCKWCREKFKLKYGHPMPEDENNPQVIKFQFDSYNEYIKRVKKEITALKPEVLLCGNWAYSLRHGGFMNPIPEVDWLSGDLPTDLSSLRRASVEGAYLSLLGIPFDLMTWDRFMPKSKETSPLPKSAGILKAEASVILAHGGRFFLWHNPNPDGSLYKTQWSIACEVANFVRKLAPFTIDNRSIAQIGILYASRSRYLRSKDYQNNMNCVYAIAQMLQELMIPYDIFNEINLKKFSSQYEVIIIPEAVVLEIETVKSLKEFVSNGGKLIIVGVPDMVDSTDEIQKLCGLKVMGRVKSNVFFKLKEGIYEVKNCEFYSVKPITARVKEECCNSINDKSGNGVPLWLEHKLGKGRVVTLTCGFCSAYHKEKYPKYRDYIEKVIDTTVGHRQIYVETIYPVEVVLNEKEGSLYVHFINHNTGKPNDSHNQHVEDMLPSVIKNFKVALDRAPKKAILVPEKKEIAFNYTNGYATVSMNKEFQYYTGVKFEF